MRSEFTHSNLQSLTRCIVTHNTDNRSAGAQRDEVREHVRSATEMHRLAPHIDYRYRRLRRDARYVAPNKLIQHNVAQHKYVTATKISQDLGSTRFS